MGDLVDNLRGWVVFFAWIGALWYIAGLLSAGEATTLRHEYGVICIFIAVGNWLLRREEEKERRAREEAERRAEERRRNSPEEIERRRQEAERLRAEAEERERQQRMEEERLAREKWQQYHKAMRIEETDGMSGRQFEQFVKTLLQRAGHSRVCETPASGDQGCDLLCESEDDGKMVVQTKRWKGSVGNQAIQEILGALLYYNAAIGLVVTNSRFTDAAKKLAAKDKRITLMDRTRLAREIREFFPRDVPEFDWDKYNKYVKGWRPH